MDFCPDCGGCRKTVLWSAATGILFFARGPRKKPKKASAAAHEIPAGDRFMKKYSAFAVAREALRHHTECSGLGASGSQETPIDVIIVGAADWSGGTAYYFG